MNRMVKKQFFFLSLVVAFFCVGVSSCVGLQAEDSKSKPILRQTKKYLPKSVSSSSLPQRSNQNTSNQAERIRTVKYKKKQSSQIITTIPQPYKKNNKTESLLFEDLPEDVSEPDQLEFFNRVIFDVNGFFDTVLFDPLSRIYGAIVPGPIRKGLHTFRDHILTPVTFLNFVLQGRGEAGAKSCLRFVINSTIGVLGFFDVAHEIGLKKEETDFNETLATWNMETGPYVMLPVLGPSSFRGALGFTADTFSDPLYYLSLNKKRRHNSAKQQLYMLESFYAVDLVNERYNKSAFINDIKKTSSDPYITIRNFYFQKQAALKKRIQDRQRATKKRSKK